MEDEFLSPKLTRQQETLREIRMQLQVLLLINLSISNLLIKKNRLRYVELMRGHNPAYKLGVFVM